MDGEYPVKSTDSEVHFECTKCGACCREDSLLVTVTGRDIARMAMGFGFGSDEVIRALDFYLISGKETPKGLRDFPSIITEHGRAYIALKKLDIFKSATVIWTVWLTNLLDPKNVPVMF